MSNELSKTTPDAFRGLAKAHAERDAEGHLVGLEAQAPPEDRLSYPLIMLVQKMSEVAGDVPPGSFWVNSFNMPLGTEFRFVPCAIRYRRVLFPEGLGAPDCVSDDGFTGVGEPGGNCLECPLGSWESARAEGRDKPACQLCYNAFGILPDLPTSTPLCLSFRSTSARYGRDLVNLIKATGANPWALTLKVTAKERSNPKGTFWVMRWQPAGATDPEIALLAAQVAKTLPLAAAPLEEESSRVDPESDAPNFTYPGPPAGEPDRTPPNGDEDKPSWV